MSNTKKDVGATCNKDGASFRVWAPFAKAVGVTGTFNNWQPTPLESEDDGYWYGQIGGAEAGQEYKYLITTDSGELYRNDPRSLQLTTTGGNSVLVTDEFDWENDNYQAPTLNQQVIYELHVGTFSRPDASTSGTFESAAKKLDYLAELGVTTIELMPIGSMPMDRGWGYAADYIYAVESLYGGRRGLMEFVKAAHRKGIGITLDVVYNHLGPDNQLDLWQFDSWSQDGKGGIYFYNDWRAATPWGETRPDYGRPEVRSYIIDNVRMWLNDCHLDGLRVDSTIYIRNVKGWNDAPGDDLAEGWSLMQDITTAAHKINPQALLIAEDVAGNEYITKDTAAGGAGFNAQWEVTFPMILRGILDAVSDADRNLSPLSDALTHHYNGDVFRRVVYSDSHDSAGNDGSARLSEEIAPGQAHSVFARRRSLLASAVVLTAPAVPMLFQGQEFMEDGSFTDWKGLDWQNAERFAGIVEAHKHLVALRLNRHGNTQGLVGQSCKIINYDDANKVLVYHRWDQGGVGDDTLVVCNFANLSQKNYAISLPRPGKWIVRFNSDWKGYSPEFGDSNFEATEDGTLELAPYSVLILSQDQPQL